MKSYPRRIRLAVLAARDGGQSTSEVAKKFGVSESWVRRVVQERRELGKLGPYIYRRRDRYCRSLQQRVMYMVLEDPRITIRELERAMGTTLSLELISGVKDMLDINLNLVWYGGMGVEVMRSASGNVTPVR